MVLLDLLKQLPLALHNKPFIDFGSGKGRALFCAEYIGFNYLTGVELDKELVDEAKANELSYTLKREGSSFEFIHQNVLDYKIPDDAQTFFLFNPFSGTIMKQVAQAILRSHEKNKREIFIVYVNPQFKSVWEENGFTLFFKEGNMLYTEALIYKL
jgi:predicted RNA methylase